MTKEELLNINLDEILLIDIREDDEVSAVPSISGAVHIPMARLIEEANQDILPKNKKVVTICRSGGRCQIVNEVLSEKGYDVDYLEGGMNSFNQ